MIAYSDGEIRQEFTFVYAAEIESGELEIDDESKEAAWLPLSSAVELPLAEFATAQAERRYAVSKGAPNAFAVTPKLPDILSIGVATHLQLGLINLMAAAEQTVELIATKEIDLFLPVMREIDFGDAFLLSMLHWYGIGKRSKPLEYWQVFLLRAKSEIIVACCQAYETLKPVHSLRYSLKRPFT